MGVQSDVTTLKEKVAMIEGIMKEMDNGLKLINTEVEKRKERKTEENQQQINCISERVLYRELSWAS